METKIIIALITACGAFLVSIISLLTAIINNRANTKAAHAIELIKQSFEQGSYARELINNEDRSSLDALKNALISIQKFKNELQLILSAIGSGLLSEVALDRISLVREELFKIYENYHSNLNDLEKKSLHTSKGIGLEIQETLFNDLNAKKNASELSSENRLKVIELRNELSEQQQSLRDSRIDRVIQLTN